MARKQSKCESGWSLQKQARSKGLYWRASHGKGDDRWVVTLGYLTVEEAEDALTRLKAQHASSKGTTSPRTEPVGYLRRRPEVVVWVDAQSEAAGQTRLGWIADHLESLAKSGT